MQTMSSMSWRRKLVFPALAFVLALMGVAAIFVTNAQRADAAVNHGTLVPELARRNLPVALDGAVRAHAVVGDRVFVGGDFTQVLLQDGTVLSQANLFAYDIDTGIFDSDFQPDVNGAVTALRANENGDGLYVGGRFTRWQEVGGPARFPLRVAKLDAQGVLDTGFLANASAVVQDIVQVGNDLYLGGDFLTINGAAIPGLARVDAQTGVVDTGFDLDINDSVAGAQLVRRLVAHPNGNELFALHFANSFGGELRRAVAKVDISSPTPVVSDWYVPWAEQTNDRLCWSSLRDMAISPDGSFIVIGGQGADNPPNCDSVLRYETAGNSRVDFTWSARMYSSVLSLAVSDQAVYVGGHFCAAPLQGAVHANGNTSNFTGTANGCDVNDVNNSINPSERDPANAVFRNQMAALDPTTAIALAWDPGTNAAFGVLDLTVTDRGLLAGQDNDRFSNFLVGRSGFFDFGPGQDTEPPVLTVTDPAAGAVVENPLVITGLATDNRDISDIRIRLRDTAAGQWVQADGSLGPNLFDFSLQESPLGNGEVAWSFNAPFLAPSTYAVRGFTTDTSGLTTPVVHTFTVQGPADCTATANADGSVDLTWSAINGASSYILRESNVFVQNVGNVTSFTVADPGVGTHDFSIRVFFGGAPTDIFCNSVTVGPPPPGAGPVCTATANGDGSVDLTWTALAGAPSYILRESNAFVQNVGNVTSFTVADPGVGTQNYSIRVFFGATQTDIFCNSVTVDPPAGGGPVCTATVLADGSVDLTWTALAGASSYILREDNVFVQNVGFTTSFNIPNPGAGTHDYSIRSFFGGGVTDIFCNSVTVGGGPPPPPPPPPNTPFCTATVLADRSVDLTWSVIPNATSYILRESNVFIQNVGFGTSFNLDNPSSGEQNYSIRSFFGGTPTDIFCNTVTVPPLGGLTCTATVLANGSVDLTWDIIPNTASYILRESGVFIQNVGNVTSFNVANPNPGTQNYEIRRFFQGQPEDIFCNSVVVP